MKARESKKDRAVALGADELIARAEWQFRNRPQKLKNLRKRYVECCVAILRAMDRPVR